MGCAPFQLDRDLPVGIREVDTERADPVLALRIRETLRAQQLDRLPLDLPMRNTEAEPVPRQLSEVARRVGEHVWRESSIPDRRIEGLFLEKPGEILDRPLDGRDRNLPKSRRVRARQVERSVNNDAPMPRSTAARHSDFDQAARPLDKLQSLAAVLSELTVPGPHARQAAKALRSSESDAPGDL